MTTKIDPTELLAKLRWAYDRAKEGAPASTDKDLFREAADEIEKLWSLVGKARVDTDFHEIVKDAKNYVAAK